MRKYYKYNYTTFITPTLSESWNIEENGFGVQVSAEFSINYPWKAFDNNTTTTGYINGIPGWFLMYNKKPIQLDSFTITNFSTYYPRTGTVSGSNDGENWIKLCDWSSNENTTYAVWTLPVNAQNCYNYFRINVDTATGNGCHFSEIVLNGRERTVVPGTPDDYDFYEDEEVYVCLRKDNEKYYTYAYRTWEQPLLTSNDGNEEFKVSTNLNSAQGATSHGFDGKTSTVTTYVSAGTRSNIDWQIRMEFKNKLNISNFQIYNRTNGSAKGIQKYFVEASDDGVNWTLVKEMTTNSVLAANANWSIPLTHNEYYKYYRINVNQVYAQNSGEYAGFWNCIITAQEQIPVEINNPTLINRSYYKYTDTSWTQPILDSNGTLGRDSFAVYSSNTMYSTSQWWHAFDTNTSTCFYSLNGVHYGNYMIYNPDPLNITQFTFRNQSTANRASAAGSIYGSNDGKNWKFITSYTNTISAANGIWDINLNHNNYYKYYNIVSDRNTANSGYWTISEITITATKRIITEGTSQDYDYYEDEWNYDFSKIETNYRPLKVLEYKEKPYTIPTLTSNGIMGGSTFACDCETHDNQLYNCFNNMDDSGYPLSDLDFGSWISWYFPFPVKLPSVRIENLDNAEINCSLKIRTSDGLNWCTIGSLLLPTTNRDIVIENDFPDLYYQWYRIEVNKSSGDLWMAIILRYLTASIQRESYKAIII